MGLPVQWCGLVYADALYRLSRYDPKGPWKHLADGITASGIQQSFPPDDPDLQGLLPDSFNLRPQTRNGVAINPGTVQACAIPFYGGPLVCDYYVSRTNGWVVHAPGALEAVRDRRGHLSFGVQGWSRKPYFVLVAGLKAEPNVRLNGSATRIEAPHTFLSNEGWLILQVEGRPQIEITLLSR